MTNALSLVVLLVGLALLVLPTTTPELSRRHDRFLGVGLLLLLPKLVSEPFPLVSGAGLTELCAAALVVGLGAEAGLDRWQKLDVEQQAALRTRERWLRSRDDLLDAFARAWNRVHAFVVEGESTADPAAAAAPSDVASSHGAADAAGGAAADTQAGSPLASAVAVWVAVKQLLTPKKPVGKLWKRPDDDGDHGDGDGGSTPDQSPEKDPQEPALPDGDGPPEADQTGAELFQQGQEESREVKAPPKAQEPDMVTVEPEPVEPVLPAPTPEAITSPPETTNTLATAEPAPAAQPSQAPTTSVEQPDMVTVEPEPVEPEPQAPESATDPGPAATADTPATAAPADTAQAPQPSEPPQAPVSPEAAGEPGDAPGHSAEQPDDVPQPSVAANFAEVDTLINRSQPDP